MNKELLVGFVYPLTAFLLGVGAATLAHEGYEKHVMLHADGPITVDGTFANREQCLNKLEAIYAPGPQQAMYQCVEVK